jgi:hypothetical protein
MTSGELKSRRARKLKSALADERLVVHAGAARECVPEKTGAEVCIARCLQRDLHASSLRHLHPGRQVLRHRIRERNLPAAHHVREQERREHLRHGADLEDRIVRVQDPANALAISANMLTIYSVRQQIKQVC